MRIILDKQDVKNAIDLDDLALEVAERVIHLLDLKSDSERPSEDSLMTVDELSLYLKMKPEWVLLKVNREEIPHYRLADAPETIRFQREIIDDWLQDSLIDERRTSYKSITLVKI